MMKNPAIPPTTLPIIAAVVGETLKGPSVDPGHFSGASIEKNRSFCGNEKEKKRQGRRCLPPTAYDLPELQKPSPCGVLSLRSH